MTTIMVCVTALAGFVLLIATVVIDVERDKRKDWQKESNHWKNRYNEHLEEYARLAKSFQDYKTGRESCGKKAPK